MSEKVETKIEETPNQATETNKKDIDVADDQHESIAEKANSGLATNDKDGNNDGVDKDAVPQRPVKRARTAYFIFAEEKRPEAQKQHPGEGVAAVGRALGQLWAALTDEEKKGYQNQAALERERVAKDLEAWNKAHGNKPSSEEASKASSRDLSVLGYPSARVRKICKLDPDVRGLSKEAVLLVTKAAELATVKLGVEAVRVAQIQNRRKLLPDDVAMVCRSRDQFAFLKQDVLDLVREQQQQQNESKKLNKMGKQASQPISSNPITSYFSPKEKIV